MKILVMSLLRIGDIVLSTPVLKALKDKHPDAEIHLLINSQFRQVASLIPSIDRTILFDRDQMQKGLGEASVPLFESYERLEELVDLLDAEGYDWIVNLTHSRLSGWMMNLISATKKTGLAFDNSGRAGFGSSWFRFLNTQVDAEGSETFHFADIFKFGLELDDVPATGPFLRETDKGKLEAGTFISDLDEARDIVVIQALTSDTKKDWSLGKWGRAMTAFARKNPSVTIAVLGAPFERERLVPLVSELNDRGVSCVLAILSFEGAFSLLKRSKLLITGDTSIKHLASAARVPVVEISLGSADPHRTGAYHHQSVIIQSREACAPCVHSRACHRASHACSDRIPADAVALVASEVYARRTFQLKTIAEEFRQEIEILRVEARVSGFWAAYSVLEAFSEESVARWVDLTCRKLWLESANGQRSLHRRGTETERLARLLKQIHPQVSGIEWRHLLADFEKQAMFVEGRINSFKVGVQHLKGTYEDATRLRVFVRQLIQFRDRIRHSPLLRSFKTSMDQIIEDDVSAPFTRFRRIVDSVHEIERRTLIHLRLIRGLANEMEEGKYEAQP